MKLKQIAAALLAVGMVLPGLASAISLNQAAEKAVLRNPEVLAKWYQFRAASEERGVAGAAFRPRVDLQAYAGVERQDYPGKPGDTFSHPGASIELRQMLFDGFASRQESRRLNHAFMSRYYEVLAISDEVAQETARAYYDVLRYRKLSELARENYAVHRETYEQIAERVRAGVGRGVDLEQAAGRLALAESNWLTEEANLQDVSARYERIVGEPPEAVMDPVPDFSGALPQQAGLLDETFQRNPVFLAAVYNLRAARAQAQGSESGNYPKLELVASQGLDRNRNGAEGSYNDSLIQLRLNYNIYGGGADNAKVRQYSELLNTAYALRDKACRDVRQSTVIAWNDVYRLNEQRRFQEQHALWTEKAREAYRRQFDIGQRSLLDVLDSENELFQARRTLVMSEFDQRLAQVRVLAQTGQLLPALQLSSLASERPEDEEGNSLKDDPDALCRSAFPAGITLDREAAMAGRLPRPALPAPVPAPAPVVTPAPVPAPTPAPMAADEGAVLEQLNRWAAMWRARDLAGYFDSYSKRFKPEWGMSRAGWERFRQRRISEARNISLRVERPVVKRIDANTFEVTFFQDYVASNYKDQVTKTLTMVREGNMWRIIREVAR